MVSNFNRLPPITVGIFHSEMMNMWWYLIILNIGMKLYPGGHSLCKTQEKL